ncbi:hypothetical protein ACFWN5_20480 [Streptomyces sp. NPDC058430]|uniref:hypothetical protein n=1 Tax=unclassified Streptomyces TaxID=2593676 RepID=UPI003630E76B
MAPQAARHRRSTKRRLIGAGAVATVAGIALTATLGANADAAWTSTWSVTASGWSGQDDPQVSIDRSGDALLAWAAMDNANSSYFRVQTRVKYANGTLGATRTLSPDGRAVSWVRADSDDTGDSSVVWQQDSTVVGRRVASSGSLVGSLQMLSTPGSPATTPSVAVTPGGSSMVAWTEIRDGSWYAVARRLKLDGTLGAMHTLGSGSAEPPAIGVDRNGQFVVAWVRGSEVVAKRMTATSISAAKVLTTPIAAYGGFGMVRVGVDRDGDAVISYRSGGGDRSQVWASRWSRTGTLSNPLRISTSTENADVHHTLGTDLDGDSMIVWVRNNAGKRELYGRKLSAGGTLGAITSQGAGDRPDLALDDDGDGMLVSQTTTAISTPPYSVTKATARLISRSGTFGSAKTLTTDGRVPQVAARPTAVFTTTWQQESYPYTIKAMTGP